jgi:uncharacterized protein
MKKIAAIIIIAIVILAGFILKTKLNSANKNLVIADKAEVAVEIADSEIARQKGYSNHPEISYQEGLLFVFNRAGFYPFWMKGMLFDLDFIFIKNGRVVYLLQNVKAPVNNNGEIEYAISQKPFNQLLEVKAGFIDKYNIELNDSVLLK